MKKIKLTQGKYALVDNEDYEYLNQWKWQFDGGYARRKPYCKITKKQYHVSMHRLIMNPTSKQEIDHINRNPLDNRKKNLRICTRGENIWNSLGPNLKNYNSLKGVTKRKNGYWEVNIRYKHKKFYAGRYKNRSLAEELYKRLSTILHGEFSPWRS